MTRRRVRSRLRHRLFAQRGEVGSSKLPSGPEVEWLRPPNEERTVIRNDAPLHAFRRVGLLPLEGRVPMHVARDGEPPPVPALSRRGLDAARKNEVVGFELQGLNHDGFSWDAPVRLTAGDASPEYKEGPTREWQAHSNIELVSAVRAYVAEEA